MTNFRRKKIATATTLLLVLSMAGATLLLPLSQAAQFPGTTIPNWAYLEVVPDKIGVGQSVLLVMWIDKPPPTANGIFGDRWINMTIYLTLPDGSTKTLGPFQSDDAGGYTTTYSPATTGDYSAYMYFPGETLTGSQGNAGYPNLNNANVNDTYGAATSNTVHFTVGEETISAIAENPLPTDYWQHPIQAFNHYWSSIAGNWLGISAVEFGNTGNYNFAGNYNPYTQAVMTGHVVWAQQLVPGSAGGQMGGEFGGTGESNYYSGFQYQPKFCPIIMNGILYYQIMDNYNSLTQGFTAVNLRTGETLWTKNYNNFFANASQDVLMCGQIYVYKTMNTYGGQTYLWATRANGSSTNLDCFDAATGNFLFTVWGGGGGGAFGRQNFQGTDGSLLQLFVNSSRVGGVTRQSLTLWNSSKCVNPTNSQFFNFQQNGNYQYDVGIVWSILLPNATSTGDAIPSWVFDDTGHSTWDPENNIMILGAGTGMYSAYGWNPGWLMKIGIDMDDGTQVFLKNQTDQVPFAASMMIPGASNGTYVEYTKETFSFSGYSTKTNDRVWGPIVAFTNPLAYYDQTSGVCAYGNLYSWSFGGEVVCLDLKDGHKVWNWSSGDTGLNTPYGTNPFWIIGNYEATVADGVFYVETGHDYGPPLFSGAKIYAMNATTGEQIWDILNFASGSSLPVTYGYMLSFNAYDNQVYCYGKGQTQTTVETSTVYNAPNQLQISGTVTDQSPGQTCLGIPAAGTPAIDDAYQSRWMEYLYMQSPKPTNATGVPVTLSYIDSNNNTFTIGNTRTDINGQYSYVFTPNIDGPYTIIASFAGSNSYFSSTAQTKMTYMSPATAAPTATQQPASMADVYFLPMSIIILVVLAIIAVMLAFVMRRRP
jgi:hypothetical protein